MVAIYLFRESNYGFRNHRREKPLGALSKKCPAHGALLRECRKDNLPALAKRPSEFYERRKDERLEKYLRYFGRQLTRTRSTEISTAVVDPRFSSQ